MKRILLSVFAVAAMSAAICKAIPSYADMPQNPNIAVWFEIPVVDMDRAVKFYNAIFELNMTVDQSNGVPMAMFPGNDSYGSAGALIKMDSMKPGTDGPAVYLNGGTNLQLVLDRVTQNGGTVVIPKTQIGPQIGFFAIFLDSEGNRLGLFSKQ